VNKNNFDRLNIHKVKKVNVTYEEDEGEIFDE
jgi:hypothetical protein